MALLYAVIGALIGGVLVLLVLLRESARRCEGFELDARSTRTELDALRSDHRRVLEQRDRLRWLEWWARNAGEAPPEDPARGFFMRWALAAHFAADFATLHRDLQRVANDERRSELERIHAKLFITEMNAPEKPWEHWARETGGPLHSAEALERAYFGALDSWRALLGASLQFENDPEFAAKRLVIPG